MSMTGDNVTSAASNYPTRTENNAPICNDCSAPVTDEGCDCLIMLVSPTGSEILGTLEQVPARANVIGWIREEDGTFTPDFEGETKCWWEGQETIMREGQIVVVDYEGNEYLLSECRPAPRCDHCHKQAQVDEYDVTDAAGTTTRRALCEYCPTLLRSDRGIGHIVPVDEEEETE